MVNTYLIQLFTKKIFDRVVFHPNRCDDSNKREAFLK